MRDYFDHKLTTLEHWQKLRKPETYTYGELQWDVNNCEGVVSFSFVVSCCDCILVCFFSSLMPFS